MSKIPPSKIIRSLSSNQTHSKIADTMTIYQFAAKNADGEDVSLDKYK